MVYGKLPDRKEMKFFCTDNVDHSIGWRERGLYNEKNLVDRSFYYLSIYAVQASIFCPRGANQNILARGGQEDV